MMESFKNEISISAVTTKIIGIILKMPFDQRRRLMANLIETKGANSRKHDRKDYLMNVQYMANGHACNGFINNISSGGLFVECPQDTLQKLSTGKPVTLTFDHPDEKIHIKITGEIARITDSGFGVSFDDFLKGFVVPDKL
ncbi:MAG: PilZ domain-containing protein [Desulfobacteraceae bacterium]|jgi:hypothetical protein|nr:PilZ domain-containing protein [Desulfobacteraceae bacterium]